MHTISSTMLNLRTLLLLNVALFVTINAMGFIVDGSRRHSGYDEEDCECEEPHNQHTKKPTTPEATTAEPTTPEATTPEATTTPEPTTTTTTVPPTTTTVTTAEPTTTQQYRIYCPVGRTFNRTATAENYYAGIVCTIAFVATQQLNPDEALGVCKDRVGSSAFLTAPESEMEAEILYNRTKTFLLNANFTAERYTVVIDGTRKAECMSADTFNVAPCTADGTFEFASPSANPSFIYANWGSGQPSNSVVNGTVKSCLGMDQDLTFRDIFCDQTQSPILNDNGETEYEVHAYYCGWNPTKEAI